MKKQKRYYILVAMLICLITLLSGQNVFATDAKDLLQEVEITEEYKEWQELSDEEKENVIEPRKYEVLTTTAVSSSPLYKVRMAAANAKTSYSLKEDIASNLTIRNQWYTGSCWTFASLSSLETNLALANIRNKKNSSKVYDYSERHMEYSTSYEFLNNEVNTKGYNRTVGSGGSWYLAESYLASGMGAINEADMPFVNNEDEIALSEIQGKTVQTQLYDTIDFADYSEATDDSKKTEIMNQIKQHIKNYGSVYARIHAKGENCYDETAGSIYCNDTTNDDSSHAVNHAVSIVGWDDNYSADNFPEDSKGAWIIRNTWGTGEYTISELRQRIFEYYSEELAEYGIYSASSIPNTLLENLGYTLDGDMAYEKIANDGYIYVSYDDCNIASALYGIIKATDTVNYDNIYQYDYYYPAYQYGSTSSKVLLATIFDKETSGTEYLTQVSLYAPETYTCKVYVNPNGTSMEGLQAVELEAGESETFNAGYHTLEFAEPIQIGTTSLSTATTGDESSNQFLVVIEVQGSSTDGVDFCLEGANDGTFSNVKTENGKCFIEPSGKMDSNSWIDADNSSWIDVGNLENVLGTGKGVNADLTIKAFTVNKVYDNSVSNLQITTAPDKTEYIEGDNFDKTGMVVQATFNDRSQSTAIIDSDGYDISNGTNLVTGQTSVIITYGGKSTQQEITVVRNSVTSLQITTAPDKTEYIEGDSFDKTGMVVQATYKNGNKKYITDYTITNGTNLTKGQTTVTISYDGQTTTQTITVAEAPKTQAAVSVKSITGISMYEMPKKLTYIQNKENLELTGGQIKVTYDDGTTEFVDLTANGVSVTGFSNTQLGKVTLNVEYKTKTTQFEVEIVKDSSTGDSQTGTTKDNPGTEQKEEEEEAKNSDLSNASGNVKSVKAYFYTSNTKQEYSLINIEIDNITRILTNDSVEYYYYLSANAAEKNITDWIKISEEQTNANKLQYTIDSRNVANYDEIYGEDVLYLYIREVAKNGGNQSVAISNAIKIEVLDNIDTYMDDVNVTVLKTSSTTTPTDTTTATGTLPKTGVKITTIVLIIVVMAIGIYLFARYRYLSKYIK
jgi:C1A family cysteine protease